MMSYKEQYKATFSQVHTGYKLEMEDLVHMKSTHRVGKKVVILAAAVLLVLASSVTALAMNWFGLKDLVIQSPEKAPEPVISGSDEPGNALDGVPGKGNGMEVPMELISLQGYPDSNEYKAVAEWTIFSDNYDTDGTLLAQVGNGPTGLDEKYSLYLVYTQEMADKLDEITSKYQLKLHQTLDMIDVEDYPGMIGKDIFLSPLAQFQGGYIYEDGTFHFDGQAVVNEHVIIGYQFGNCVKGSFTDTILNIGDLDNYKNWSYQTASGVTVSLAISPEKSLVIVDMERSFVTINVLAGTNTITEGDLEAFADLFDFAALK